ncbi:hypothetical protein SynMITS9220_02520 [Synechococcus sp. MIT S9220]|nr:hypothetical protein SynMITS9220_02520 [Synechococcus sp. MIT S9220]
MNGGIKTHSSKTHLEATHYSRLQATRAKHRRKQSIQISVEQAFRIIQSLRQRLHENLPKNDFST